MARRRYYRRSTRVVYPKKKWASNMIQNTLTSDAGIVIAANSLPTTQGALTLPTPVIVKTGNFKIQGDVTISATNPGYTSIYLFLLYAPEGISTSYADLSASISAHPEWVMGWTALDAPYLSAGTSAGNKFSITSRLKRNLNSGDRIILFMKVDGISGVTCTAPFMAQFWTCSN